jgi:hypothetical protein
MHAQVLNTKEQEHEANREAKNQETEDVLDQLPMLTMANHEDVVRELCVLCLHPNPNAKWVSQIAWVKEQYMAKVKEDYPPGTEGDMQQALNNVVWNGRLEQIAREVFWDHRKAGRECCFCCS